MEMLQERAAIIRNTRSFFDRKNYLELDTPLLCPDLIPESCLEVFKTERLFPRASKKENYPLYLIPSPEIWMKKIIAQHRANIYQICKCFRNGESSGHLHNCEFTMLEYYTMDADYMDSLSLTEELFGYLFKKKKEQKNEKFETGNEKPGVKDGQFADNSEQRAEKFLTFERITVAQAFEQWAGFDLFTAAADAGSMEREAQKLKLEPPPGLTTAELYDLIFIHAVEPHLKPERPVALLDYPAFVPCLAKIKPDGRTVERWELYYNGIELANCFSEETDPQRVKYFFINEERAKANGAITRHNVDHDYWKIFDRRGFPRCSGVAMGLDRLIMALTGRSSIDGVLPFAMKD